MPPQKERRSEEGSHHLAFGDVLEMAKKIALKQGGHKPMVIIKGTRQTIPVELNEMPEPYKERAGYFLALGHAIAYEGLVGELRQVFWISEVWVSTSTDIRPSQDPQKQEGLIVAGIQIPQNKVESQILIMKRDKQDKLIDLEQTFQEDRVQKLDSPLLKIFIHGFRAGEIQKRQRLN